MGFIEAQQELTILTIVIPILYVALYTTVNAALQLSVGLVVFGGRDPSVSGRNRLLLETFVAVPFFGSINADIGWHF